jgi:hypothetical protein
MLANKLDDPNTLDTFVMTVDNDVQDHGSNVADTNVGKMCGVVKNVDVWASKLLNHLPDDDPRPGATNGGS